MNVKGVCKRYIGSVSVCWARVLRRNVRMGTPEISTNSHHIFPPWMLLDPEEVDDQLQSVLRRRTSICSCFPASTISIKAFNLSLPMPCPNYKRW
jgi:hypothetical protein